jgi:guanosine-3',5'-bis(diphosphate) 3'-pyrophosphohydrolase
VLAAGDPPFVGDRPLVREAMRWAEHRHSGDRRDVDSAPYILHPLEVAALLSGRGYDEEVVSAGLLHDVVERSDAGVEAVRERFGDRVAGIVAAVTEDDGIADYGSRKAALRDQVTRAGGDAQSVYAADKLAKARELRAHAGRAGSSLADPALSRRLEHYEASLEMLQRAGAAAPLVEQLAFELWALRHLPPQSSSGR